MKHYSRIFLNGAAKPAAITALLGTAITTYINGVKGLIAGAIAATLVVAFFLVHILLAKVTATMDPRATYAIVLAAYFLKVLVMVVFLVVIGNFDLDRRSFAAVALGVTLGWLGGEIRAYLKLGGGYGSSR
ncbi:hypothetical protein LBMAG10_05760 [Actinomycetes bacterium]|nr:hypothetical protein LBMAG10_05760 [Actinomycetes bacterium]